MTAKTKFTGIKVVSSGYVGVEEGTWVSVVVYFAVTNAKNHTMRMRIKVLRCSHAGDKTIRKTQLTCSQI